MQTRMWGGVSQKLTANYQRRGGGMKCWELIQSSKEACSNSPLSSLAIGLSLAEVTWFSSPLNMDKCTTKSKVWWPKGQFLTKLAASKRKQAIRFNQWSLPLSSIDEFVFGQVWGCLRNVRPTRPGEDLWRKSFPRAFLPVRGGRECERSHYYRWRSQITCQG